MSEPTLTATRIAEPATATADLTTKTYGPGGIFNNSFFSIAGQKERLANVGATLVAAVGPGKVRSNTGVKAIDAPLQLAANHPFLTAGVAAGAITAVRTLGAASVGKVAAGGAGASLAASPTLRTAAIAAGAGALVGAGLFGGGKGGDSTPTQTTNPTQNTTTNQTTTYSTYAPTNNIVRNTITGSPGATIGQVTQGGAPITQSPIASTIPTQNTSPDQTSTGGSGSEGISPILLLGAAALVFAVARE